MPRVTRSISVGKSVNKWMLGVSLFMIFSGAVIVSKFDSWYVIVGGAVLGVAGCYFNQKSVRWLMQ